MDKIKELLKKIGASEEVAGNIISALNEWRDSVQEKLMVEFRERLQKAQTVVVEETEGYKLDLARKVEIFLESQIATIERDARERHAIEESKAVNDLKRAHAILEGYNVDGTPSVDLQAVKNENEQLRRQLVTVTEQRNNASAKYEQAYDIASKSLIRAKFLESKVLNSAEKEITESKTKITEKKAEKPAEVKTTRPTLAESQVMRKTEKKVGFGGTPEISAIAAKIDEIA